MSDMGIFITIFAFVIGFAAGWHRSIPLFVVSQALRRVLGTPA